MEYLDEGFSEDVAVEAGIDSRAVFPDAESMIGEDGRHTSHGGITENFDSDVANVSSSSKASLEANVILDKSGSVNLEDRVADSQLDIIDDDLRSWEAISDGEGRSVDLSMEGYRADVVYRAASSSLASSQIKQFWETGFWEQFMDSSKLAIDCFATELKRLLPYHDFNSVDEEPQPKRAVRSKPQMHFMDHVKDAAEASWQEEREALWQTAIFRWRSMICQWDDSPAMVKQVRSRSEFVDQAQILVDIFFNKAPATLLKRVRSLSKMTNYFLARGGAFPCSEDNVYEFLCCERESGAKPSSIKGYLESMTFARHVLGVTEFEATIVSRRCQGVAASHGEIKARQADQAVGEASRHPGKGRGR